MHPTFWSFIISATDELERVENDIPSFLYGSLVPVVSTLYKSLKEERERVRANYEAGLIDLDGMMGKIGALSLATGKAKAATDDDENIPSPRKRPNPADKVVEPVAVQRKKRPGRPPKNTGKSLPDAVMREDPVQEVCISNLPVPPLRGLQAINAALPSTSARTTASAVRQIVSAEASFGPISLSWSLTSKSELETHIEKFNLGLRERSPIPAVGNCWYWENVDLVKKFIIAPEDPDKLRKAVANSIETHKYRND